MKLACTNNKRRFQLGWGKWTRGVLSYRSILSVPGGRETGRGLLAYVRLVQSPEDLALRVSFLVLVRIAAALVTMVVIIVIGAAPMDLDMPTFDLTRGAIAG